MTVVLPELSLIVIIGPSGAGKSTFARKHFLPTEVLSSDYCRGLVADNDNDQSVTPEAFEVLHFIAAKRLAKGRLTVLDATTIRPKDRNPLDELGQFLRLPGYTSAGEADEDGVWAGPIWPHSEGRKTALLRDLVDRRPRIFDCTNASS